MNEPTIQTLERSIDIHFTGETTGDELMDYITDAYDELAINSESLIIMTIKKVTEKEYNKR